MTVPKAGTPKPRPTDRLSRFRDVLAWRLANLVLNTVATKWYRHMVRDTIILGLAKAEKARALSREMQEGRQS